MSLPAYEGLRLPGSAASPAEWTGSPAAHPGTPGRAHLTRPEPPRTSPRSAALRLVGAEQGCCQARDFVRRTLGDWALDHCSADALMVVTELAANAVLHAAPHSAPHPLAAGEPEIWLRLSLRRPAHLVCAVTDPSDNPPVYPHTSDPLDEHGRGLRIIDALSEHWGWTRRQPNGKTVWAMLPTGSQV
ncbi:MULTISPECIES: ATP-binding protein [unclassified Streptomyces]|uniref:ATP-binding protein n=1 Tax=unclassified Streptomyces TaxID=2593676 RepID=UPI0023661319|nr:MULTISPECIES: ATP-binding protein [unclassified Streptomyces]MDF3147449.1 ATP-binding protein [Streptomyces sp. T21Q-yed]WDF41252.1 ATP-binding protein [Streptomyces sp. T12]